MMISTNPIDIVPVAVALVFIAVILRALWPPITRFALGLPQGSVRAIIALSISFVFLVTVWKAVSVSATNESQVNHLPLATVIELMKTSPLTAKVEPEVKGQPATYSVTLRSPNQSSVELTKQLVGALINAVIGVTAYYLASSSVQQATQTGASFNQMNSSGIATGPTTITSAQVTSNSPSWVIQATGVGMNNISALVLRPPVGSTITSEIRSVSFQRSEPSLLLADFGSQLIPPGTYFVDYLLPSVAVQRTGVQIQILSTPPKP